MKTLEDALRAREGWDRMTAEVQEGRLFTLRRLQTALGVTTITEFAQLTGRAIEAARVKMLTSYKPSTVQQTMRMGNLLWRTLEREGLMHSTAWLLREKTRGARSPDWNVCKPDEVDKLIKATPRGSRQRVLVLMFLWHGQRVSELCRMTMGNVSPTGEMEWIAKGDKLRRMQIQPIALEAAREWHARVGLDSRFASTPLIPLDAAGAHHDRKQVYHLIKKLTERVLGHRVTPHGLRATFISMKTAEDSIERARQLAGHSALKTTERYQRWNTAKDTERKLPKGA